MFGYCAPIGSKLRPPTAPSAAPVKYCSRANPCFVACLGNDVPQRTTHMKEMAAGGQEIFEGKKTQMLPLRLLVLNEKNKNKKKNEKKAK